MILNNRKILQKLEKIPKQIERILKKINAKKIIRNEA